MIIFIYKYSFCGWISAATFCWGTIEQIAMLRLDQRIPTSKARYPREAWHWSIIRNCSAGSCLCAFLGLTILKWSPIGLNSIPLKLYKQHDKHNTKSKRILHNPTSRTVFVLLASSCPHVNMIFWVVIKYTCNLLFCFACLTLYHKHFMSLHSLHNYNF